MHKTSVISKKASLVGGFFVLLSLLSSCGGPTEGNYEVFRYNEPTGIPTLDPAFAKDKSTLWAVQQLYEGLLSLDQNNEVQPGLASTFQVDTSGRVYTFHLREANFHSGRTLGAADVLYSFNRLTDPEVASPGAWVLDRVDSVWATNSKTVHLQLNEPFASFPSMLCMAYCSIVDAEATANSLAVSSAGTGPFKTHVWHQGEKLILHKNDAYWKQDAAGQPLPYLDGVSISFLPDQQSAFLEYLSGSFDFLPNIDPSFKDDLLTKEGTLRAKYADAHRLERTPFLNTEYLVFNAESALPHDLRWAINAGIDRTKMIDELRSGVGIPGNGGIVPFGLPEYQEGIGIAYQPDSVARLFASKKELPALVLTTVANYRDLCEFVQGSLADLGWSIEVNVIPSAALRSEKSAGSLEFFRASWIADYPDAENYLLLFYSGFKAPNGPNYSRYESAEFDALYEELLRAPSQEERSRLARTADAALMKDAACVPLYYDEVSRVLPKSTTGLQTNALNALILTEVRLNR